MNEGPSRLLINRKKDQTNKDIGIKFKMEMMIMADQQQRSLQNSTLQNSTSASESTSGFEIDDLSGTPMHEVILDTLKVYGVIFCVLFILFLLVRRFFPKPYFILRESDDDATELSKRTFGPISFLWKVFTVSDEEIFNECGLDATVFIRTLRFGMR